MRVRGSRFGGVMLAVTWGCSGAAPAAPQGATAPATVPTVPPTAPTAVRCVPEDLAACRAQCEQGEAGHCNALGELTRDGKGVEASDVDAVGLFEQACESARREVAITLRQPCEAKRTALPGVNALKVIHAIAEK